MSQESLPVNEAVHVIEYENIYRTDKWWCAVALVNMFGHNKIAVYQWIKDTKTGKWKRKQKFTINHASDWERMQEIIERLLPKAGI